MFFRPNSYVVRPRIISSIDTHLELGTFSRLIRSGYIEELDWHFHDLAQTRNHSLLFLIILHFFLFTISLHYCSSSRSTGRFDNTIFLISQMTLLFLFRLVRGVVLCIYIFYSMMDKVTILKNWKYSRQRLCFSYLPLPQLLLANLRIVIFWSNNIDLYLSLSSGTGYLPFYASIISL